jgi:hypothetical protein
MNPTETGSDVDLLTCVRIGQVAGFCKHGNELRIPKSAASFQTEKLPRHKTLLHVVSQLIGRSVISTPCIPKTTHNESRYCDSVTE